MSQIHIDQIDQCPMGVPADVADLTQILMRRLEQVDRRLKRLDQIERRLLEAEALEAQRREATAALAAGFAGIAAAVDRLSALS